MKKTIYILFIALVFGFILGIIFFRINKMKKIDNSTLISSDEKLIDDECTKWEELNSVNANSIENKISPKAKLIIRVLYKQCNHLVEIKEEVNDEGLINLTEEEFQSKYPDWQIQRFSPTEIIIYKEVDDFCDEHYKIKENDGKIAIYKIDKNGKENLEKTTDISISYLTNEDVEKIKNEILVYSKKELNKILEDFE